MLSLLRKQQGIWTSRGLGPQIPIHPCSDDKGLETSLRWSCCLLRHEEMASQGGQTVKTPGQGIGLPTLRLSGGVFILDEEVKVTHPLSAP